MEKKTLDIFPEGITIIKFGAEWCGPCQLLNKNLESFSNMDYVHVVKYDIEKDLELATENGIMSIPVLMFYKDGVYIGRTVGALSVKAINEIIEGKKILEH